MMEKAWVWLKMFGIYWYDRAKDNDEWSEIIPRLFVGNCRAAHDKEFLKTNNIEMIINCTKEIPFKKSAIEELGIKTIRIPVWDNGEKKEIENMGLFLPEVYKDMAKFYEKNQEKSILINCFAGKQRSAICATYFISKFFSISKDDAIELVKNKRKECFQPKINFYNSF